MAWLLLQETGIPLYGVLVLVGRNCGMSGGNIDGIHEYALSSDGREHEVRLWGWVGGRRAPWVVRWVERWIDIIIYKSVGLSGGVCACMYLCIYIIMYL